MNEFESSPLKKGSSALYAVIIIMALAIVGLLIWQFSTRNRLDSLLDEKEKARVALKQDLDSLMQEHEQVKQLYGVLSDSLFVKDSVIQANAIEIKRLLDTEWEYYKVKKKLGQLQVIAQGYVRQMDSLYRVNASLTEENQTIKKDLKELRKEKEDIEKDKQVLSEKVGLASTLRVYNAEATGVRFKSGGEKEVATDKAQKVDQVKVCFTVAENEIAVAGIKQIYVRIARPDKEILTKGKLDEYTFEFEGKMIQYSMMETIDYQNDAVKLCLYWKKSYSQQEMPPGLYHADIFCEGSEIGHTTFTLR